jgi:hypothetical protein
MVVEYLSNLMFVRSTSVKIHKNAYANIGVFVRYTNLKIYKNDCVVVIMIFQRLTLNSNCRWC